MLLILGECHKNYRCATHVRTRLCLTISWSLAFSWSANPQ